MMTIKELKEMLDKYPEDAIVMYRHNKYGRIDIDKIDYKEENTASKHFKSLILEASFEED